MRKKLLSLLLSLAMLLTLLPASALAAELTDDQKDALIAQGYTEEEIAELEAEGKIMVIDEDTVLEEDFDGLILVVGGTVTVKGVSVGVGVVVLPGAVDAKIVLTGTAEVNAVVMLEEKAELVLEAEATVTYLTLAAPATVEIAGTVEQFNLEESAEGASVVLTETAKVVEVNTDAPNTTIEIAAGAEVGEINVGETATGTEITGEGAADVTVNDEAGNATVNGEPTTPAEDEKTGEDEDKKDEEPEDEETEESSGSGNVPPMTTLPDDGEDDNNNGDNNEDDPPAPPAPTDPEANNAAGIKSAPLHDTRGTIEDAELYSEYYVTAVNNTTSGEIDVTFHATNLQEHGNSTNPTVVRDWVGIAIPIKGDHDGGDVTAEQFIANGGTAEQWNSRYCYLLLQIKKGEDGTVESVNCVDKANTNSKDIVKLEGDDTEYNVFYFPGTNHQSAIEERGYELKLLVTERKYYASGSIGEEGANTAISNAALVLNLMFDLTTEPEEENLIAPTNLVDMPADAADSEDDADDVDDADGTDDAAGADGADDVDGAGDSQNADDSQDTGDSQGADDSAGNVVPDEAPKTDED